MLHSNEYQKTERDGDTEKGRQHPALHSRRLLMTTKVVLTNSESHNQVIFKSQWNPDNATSTTQSKELNRMVL